MVSKALATSRKTAPASFFSTKFLVILSTSPASCKDVLCLYLYPNCSSHISPCSCTTCKILASRIFSNNLTIVSKRLMGGLEEGSAGSFSGLKREITRACFQTWGK